MTNPRQAAQAVAGRGNLVGNGRISSTSEGNYVHVNAYSREEQFDLPMAGRFEVEQAVGAAKEAFPAWRDMPALQRQGLMMRLADLLDEHAAEIGSLTAVESSTPILQGPAWVSFAAIWTRYYAGWIDKIDGLSVPVYLGRGIDYTIPEPYGVIAVIPPFNGPIGSMGLKVAPALAAGNTVVIKPPELSSLAVLRWGELALEAGFPPGVVNVVPGGGVAGEALVSHPDVAKITFTGGNETARSIMRSAATSLTPLTFELGGKSANIVFQDADLDIAVPVSLDMSVLLFSGQVCLAPTRMYVHDTIYDEMLERITAHLAAVQQGDPFDESTTMGPMVSAGHHERVLSIIERAERDHEGTLHTGGSAGEGGYFIRPTVFSDVDPDSPLAREEIFGPVLSMMRFSDEEQAIELANDSAFGLSAWVQTRDLGTAHRVAQRLEAGYVNINGFAGLAPNMPFGGNKQSGFGREGGRAGLDEFLQTKNVYIAL
jgi:aldehyde dehydrogenase (NAD+)